MMLLNLILRILTIIKQFSLFEIITFILLIGISFNTEPSTENLFAENPYCYLLNNGNYIVFNPKGIYVCDPNFSTIYNSIQYVNNFNIDKFSVIQFPITDGGNIIAIINNALYFFNSEGNLINTYQNFDQSIGGSRYYNLLLYKKENNKFHYLLIYIVSNIKFYHYSVDNNNNNLEFSNTYNPISNNVDRFPINGQGLSCVIMNSEKYKSILNCVYQSSQNSLESHCFFLSNFTEIEELFNHTSNLNGDFILSIASPDKTKALICLKSNTHGSCTKYDVNTNELSEIQLYIDICRDSCSNVKLYYFQKKKEYYFMAMDYNGKIGVVKFDENFNVVNDKIPTTVYFLPENCSMAHSFSIIYLEEKNDYFIFIDAYCLEYSNFEYKGQLYHFKTSLNNETNSTSDDDPDIDDYLVQIIQKNFSIINTDSFIEINFQEKNNMLILSKFDDNKLDETYHGINIFYRNIKGSLFWKTSNGDIKIDSNQAKKGISTIKYIPPEGQYGFTETFTVSVYYENTLVSDKINYYIFVCKNNCSCSNSFNEYCDSCLSNYVYYLNKKTCMLNSEINTNKNYFLDENNIYQNCYYLCKTCNNYFDEQKNLMNCLSCFEDNGYHLSNQNNCIEDCKTCYYFDEETKEKICLNSNNCPENYPFKNTSNNECIKEISYESLINGEIKSDINGLNKTYTILIDSITNGKINMTNNTEDIIIEGNDIVYQITLSDKQKDPNYKSNFSVIYLNDCENLLRKQENLDENISFIILKVDIERNESSTDQVEYEIINPITYKKVDLTICKNTTITILSPIEMDQRTINIYNDLQNQGYDLYDANDSFYNDVCAKYSVNGTDVSLSVRKEDFYDEDIILCEKNCEYVEINTEDEKVTCECDAKNGINSNSAKEEVFQPQILFENFYKLDTYSNFKILRCYKLVFSLEGIKGNYISYIMMIIFCIFLASMIWNYFSYTNNIKKLFKKLFKKKNILSIFSVFLGNQLKKFNINFDKIDPNDNKNKVEPKNDLVILNDNKNEISQGKTKDNDLERKNTIEDNKKDNPITKWIHKLRRQSVSKIKGVINPPLKKAKNIYCDVEESKGKVTYSYMRGSLKNRRKKPKNLKKMTFLIKDLPEENSNEKDFAVKNVILRMNNDPNCASGQSSENIFSKHLGNSSRNPINNDVNNRTKDGSKIPITIIDDNKNNINKDENNNINKNEQNDDKKDSFIDEELNAMEYEKALKYDTRRYFKYYWSLIKRKNLIILTFVSNDDNDYNIFLLKFSLLTLSFSLFFTINAIFFRDSTMKNIYYSKGKFDFLYQLPQIIYSSLLSSITIFILKKLSLVQSEAITLVKDMNNEKIQQKMKSFKCKMIVFFIFGILLLLFFWYYITAFGAVYKNTQKHLIKDTALSFLMSMIYPFVYTWIPTILRIKSLETHDRPRMYKLSKIISLV